MVDWGVFAMPGNTFLPAAGPAGTVIALLAGMGIMLIIGGNFSYLMGRSSLMWLAKRLMNGETMEEMKGSLVGGGTVLMLPIFTGLLVMMYVQNLVRKKHEASEREKIRAVEGSMNGHIAKPIDVQVTIQTITDVLNGTSTPESDP